MLPTIRRIVIGLFCLNLLFIVLHLSPLSEGPANKLNMDAEIGIPAWFTQAMLFSSAAMAGAIGYYRSKKKDYYAPTWFGMSIILLYMCIDEAIGLHEQLARPVREALDITQGPLVFAWTIPAFFVVILVAVFFFRFFLDLPRRTKLLLGSAATIYILGAMGMELVSGYYWTEQNFVFNHIYRILTAIEEGLENTGVILAITALAETLVSEKAKAKTLPRRKTASPPKKLPAKRKTKVSRR